MPYTHTVKLDGKTALVTGGAVRIGRAVCEALAARGCGVVIHYRNSASAARDVAGDLKSKGTPVHLVGGDLSTESGCCDVLNEAWGKARSLDILVNNAATFYRDPLARTTGSSMLAAMNVNLFAPVFLMREFAARVTAGKVVNILDTRIASNQRDCLPYLLSKKALADATRSIALELAPRITVNGVAPGPVLAPAGDAADNTEKAGLIPLQTRPGPDNVAEAVLFLLSCDAITGEVIFVDGGQHLLGAVNN